MKVFITGGAGYVGSHLAFELLRLGSEIVIIDNLSKAQTIHPTLLPFLMKMDISLDRDYRSLLNLIKTGSENDAVIHLSAKKSVSESIRNPDAYVKNNLGGTKNILKALSESKMRNFYFASSAAVYGSGQKTVSENDQLGPLSPYAQAKIEEEILIQKMTLSSDLRAVVFRFFNIAGARNTSMIEKAGENLIPKAILAASRNETFKIFGSNYNTPDGTCVRDYIHVMDVVEALVLALKDSHRKKFLTLNLGTGKGTSVLNLIREIQRYTKLDVQFSGRRPGDMDTLIADSNLAFNILGWKPTRGLPEIVRSSIPNL